MLYHTNLSNTVQRLIRQRRITLAGHRKLKIYGLLACSSGKRMQKENRVFFANEAEAVAEGYRPCGHCMRQKYKLWKETGKL